MHTLARRRSRSVSLLASVLLLAVLIGLPAPAAAAARVSGIHVLTASRVSLTFVDHRTHETPTGTTLRKGQQIDFTATVRPFFANVPIHVRWEVWGTRGGRFKVLIASTSDADTNPIHLGQAGFDVSFNQVGRYSVRAMAVATSASLASAWTPFRSFNVR
jgi:hypothetical protein